MATSRTIAMAMPMVSRTYALPDFSDALLQLLPTARTNWSHWTQEKTLDGSPKEVRVRRDALTDQRLLRLYNSPTEFIGLPLGEKTRYFIIDIDAGTRYHNPEEVSRLVKLFEDRRITVHVCQSSPSGGYHLICIFTRRVKSSRLSKFLNAFLRRHWFDMFRGGLEVWPSESTINRPIRLPFQAQQGFYLLDPYNDLLPSWWPASDADRVRRFLSLEQTDPNLANLRPPPLKEELANTAGRNLEKYELGEQYYHHGLTGPSQRNEALQAISHYLFYSGYGYDKKDERYELMADWVERKHNGHSKDWDRNPQGVLSEIRSMVYWEPTGRKPLSGDALKYAKHNAEKTAHCKLRIMSAITHLRATGELWLKNGRVNRSAIANLANVDPRTVKAHFDLVEAEARKPLLL